MTNSDTKATLSFSDGSPSLELPIYKGTIGPDVIDIRKLYSTTGKFTYDPGFMSTAACNSSITYIDGDKGEMLYRADEATPEELKRLPPIYELAWNHTTLRALKSDPTITYLQTRYPTLAHVEKIVALLGDELPMHIEMTRQDGEVTFAGLPMVRYTTEARLDEIVRIHEDNGCAVFNPHRYTLEEGGMKKTDRKQLAFKQEADPKGMLNPGKMIAWENPDFDFNAGKAWLFDGLNPVTAV